MPAVTKWADIWGKPKVFPSAGSQDPLTWGFAVTIDPALTTGLVTQGAASRCIFVRLATGGTISKVGFTVGVASGNVGVAAYSNSGSGRSAVPGTRLAASGSVTCPTAGYAEVSLGASVSVQPGDWLALAVDNTTATIGAQSAGVASTGMVNGRTAFQDTSAFPPPTTPSIAGYGARMLVLIGVP